MDEKKEKILIVEDNKALAKLISKKIQSNTAFDMDVAYSLEEAKLLTKGNKEYFIALLDLNLPDAPNGEVVDYMITKNIPSIVLTANVDTKTRDEILKKDVIDYVFKGNMDDVNYIFTLIERLSNNRKCKVMVVDDSLPMRNEIKKILQKQMYQVFCAAHGEEALAYMEDNKDMKLILTDYHMPVMDGFELTKTIRESYSKMELSIIAITAKTEEHLSSKFLKVGASDFINKPFTKEEIVCRVNNSIESLEYIETITAMANIDLLTGVNNRKSFFSGVKEYINKAVENYETYAVAMIDVDDFKKINDTFGHEIGDSAIKNLADILKENTKGSDIIGRFEGEEFCLLLKNVDKAEAVKFFVRLCFKIAKSTINTDKGVINYTVSIGVTFSNDGDIEEMINEADMALYRAKNAGKNRVEIAEE